MHKFDPQIVDILGKHMSCDVHSEETNQIINDLKDELKEFCEENIVQLSKLSFVNREAVLLIWNRFLKNDPKITWSRIWHLVVLNHWIKTNHIDC